MVCIESKLDYLDKLDISEEYLVFSKCRQKFEKKSGGITLIYRKAIASNITFLKSDSEFVQWVKLKKLQATQMYF